MMTVPARFMALANTELPNEVMLVGRVMVTRSLQLLKAFVGNTVGSA
jgi:hypothetical protein